ncbi:hypothetical protein C8J56DRAFT_1120325 [Mycena floridula]|nr:hypothetical protein C8J56DRAFT_1120325 [Mycena floridula]
MYTKFQSNPTCFDQVIEGLLVYKVVISHFGQFYLILKYAYLSHSSTDSHKNWIYTFAFGGTIHWSYAKIQDTLNGQQNSVYKVLVVYNVPVKDWFVAHVLATLPAKDIEFKEFRIQGQRASLVEIAGLLDKEIACVNELPGEHVQIKIMLLDEFEKGFGSTGWYPSIQREDYELAGSANKLWPGHKWVTLQQFYN